MKPTILIVEDSEATRRRLDLAITKCARFELIGSVNCFQAAVTFLKQSPPDILLTDLDLPDGDGTDLIRMVQESISTTQLSIVISVFGDGEHVIKAIKAGASGYLLKDDDYIEINDAISMMLSGGAPMSPNIARQLLNELSLASENEASSPDDNDCLLSPREKEVLVLVSKGYTSREIADMLSLSYHTVREYISNMYKKLSVKNRTQAVFEATQLGII